MSDTAQKPENTGHLQEKRDERGRFQKGVSGNPKGKPIGSVSIVAKLKNELQKVPVGQKSSRLEELVSKILKKAIEEGNENMIKLVVNYIDGMPKQTMDLEAKVEETHIPMDNQRIQELVREAEDKILNELDK